MTGFDDRVRAAARQLDRPDLVAEFLAYRVVEDGHHQRAATPEGRAALDAAARAVSRPGPTRNDRATVGGARAAPARRQRGPVERPVAEAELAALAGAAAAGSVTARGELAVRLWPVLARYCATRLDRASSVPLDGVVQAVLREVLDRLPDRGDRPVLVHAHVVASQCVVDHLREAATGPGIPRAGADALLEVLGTLPRGQRDVLVLRILLGCSAEETAEHLRTTPGAVRVAQHRALATVRGTGAPDV